MNIVELIEWIDSQKNKEKLPRYIHIDDVNQNQVLINNKWKNYPYAWGTLFKDSKWLYFETDDERGYISDLESFNSENEVCDYIKRKFDIRLKAMNGNTHADMAIRYIQKQYGYPESRSRKMIDQMLKHEDIFEEFFNYIRVGKFISKNGKKIELSGYTAEQLHENFKLSPLGAYNFLIYLEEEPQEALADLKKGLPRK